jgi:hypothetical protein
MLSTGSIAMTKDILHILSKYIPEDLCYIL